MVLPNFNEICARIAALDAWDAVYPWNWAVVPRNARKAVLVSPQKGENEFIKTRLMLFPGIRTFERFRLHTMKHVSTVTFTPADIEHDEVVFLNDGKFDFVSFFPGYVPASRTQNIPETVRKVLWEVFGLMMRIEEDPSLPAKYDDERAMFSRREEEPGRWVDAPLPLPRAPLPLKRTIALLNKDINAAKALGLTQGAAWEIVFAPVPNKMTRGPEPRACYALAVADAATRAEISLQAMSVPPVRDRNGLAKLWDSLAQRLLSLMTAGNTVPAELHVSDTRLLNALHPLALNLPFKMTVHAKLPGAQAALKRFANK